MCSLEEICENPSWKLEHMVTIVYETIRNTNIVFTYCLQTRYKLAILSLRTIYWLEKWPYVLQSSWISQKSGALIVRYSQKKELISFVFYCSEENHSIAYNLEPLVWFRWGFQHNVLKWALQFNRKLKMLHVRLQTDWSHHIFCQCKKIHSFSIDFWTGTVKSYLLYNLKHVVYHVHELTFKTQVEVHCQGWTTIVQEFTESEKLDQEVS